MWYVTDMDRTFVESFETELEAKQRTQEYTMSSRAAFYDKDFSEYRTPLYLQEQGERVRAVYVMNEEGARKNGFQDIIVSQEEIILYHGTTVASGRKIAMEGFITDLKYNWKVHSKKNFVYLSKAYAPFYAMTAKSKSKMRALVKVTVSMDKLYPEDDFLMYALGKPVYTQEELDAISIEQYKQHASESLKYMGNACAKPRDIKVIGVTEFDSSRLIMVCDPSISPINYKIMGTYYENLTEWIYEGNNPQDFLRSDRNPQRVPDEFYNMGK